MDWKTFFQLCMGFVLVIFLGGGTVYGCIQTWRGKDSE